MLPLRERARYVSDHGVTWSLLPLLLGGALAAAVAVAWLLKLAYVNGWYLILLLPALGGLALGGVLYALVRWSHCRNRWLAGTVGVVAGLTAYLGYYQFCLVDFLPPGFGWRVDLLPRYIAFRLQTDRPQDLGKPNPGPQPAKPFVLWNWFAFGCELLMVAGAAAGFAWARARQAYCRELGQWMRRELALLPATAGPNFLAALEAGTLAEFATAPPVVTDVQTACQLLLEYAVPGDGSAFDFPIFASFKDSPVSRSGQRPRFLPRTLLRQVELEPAEVLALRPLFPNLARVLELQHTELRDLPAAVGPAQGAEVPVTDVAVMTPVPEPFRQRVRSKGYALRVNLLGAIPAVYFLGGIGGMAGGIWLAINGSIPLGCTLAVAGAAAFSWGTYTALYCLGVYENRWIERRLRQEIGQRADPLVDPQDPEAVYVSLIPRESFVQIRWTMASDLLLLKLDERRQRLVLEGDADRYCIPAGAVAVCEPQCFFHPIDLQHRNHLWMVRLMVRFEEGLRELLVSVGHTGWGPLTNARRRARAEALCLRINRLRG